MLKKGTLIGKAEIAALKSAGIAEIVVARIEPGDVSEDAAAAEIAAAVAGEGVHVERAFTGRANLFAETAGVLVVDKDAVDRLNQVEESITFATLPAYKPVVAGEMIATVKIIPFAVAAKARDAALAVARNARPLVRIAPYRIRKIGVVSTLLPGLAGKVIEKTLKVTEERLAPAGAGIVAERRVPHEQRALARAIEEVLAEGSTGIPKCSTPPPIASTAAVITSRRSAIAEAPNTMTISAPSPSTSSMRLRQRPLLVRHAPLRHDARRPRAQAVPRSSSGSSRSPCGESRQQRRDDADLAHPVRARRAPAVRAFARPRAHASRASPATANGMIFTVAIISPATTGL